MDVLLNSLTFGLAVRQLQRAAAELAEDAKAEYDRAVAHKPGCPLGELDARDAAYLQERSAALYLAARVLMLVDSPYGSTIERADALFARLAATRAVEAAE